MERGQVPAVRRSTAWAEEDEEERVARDAAAEEDDEAEDIDEPDALEPEDADTGASSKPGPGPLMVYKLLGHEKANARVVKSLMKQFGYQRIEKGTKYTLLWSRTQLANKCYERLKPLQKTNSFPGMGVLRKKDTLYAHLNRMKAAFPEEYGGLFPESFVLPEEEAAFAAAHAREPPGTLFISKPKHSYGGHGIRLFSTLSAMPPGDRVVQRYIDDPYLVRGYKFDLRLYALVASWEPLVVYLHEDGLVRFCTQKYKRGRENASNTFMHLTNYTLQSRSPNFVENEDPSRDDVGSKWNLGGLWRFMRKHGVDVDRLRASLADVVVKAVLAAESTVAAAVRKHVPGRGNCFQMLGVDVMLDRRLRPLLLECNGAPSLDLPTVLDKQVKPRVYADLLNILALAPPRPDLPARPVALTPLAKMRLAAASPEERRAVLEIRREMERRGGFEVPAPPPPPPAPPAPTGPPPVPEPRHGLFEPERTGLNDVLDDAVKHAVKHINKQNMSGSPFKLKFCNSAQVAVGVLYNISLTVDKLPFQLSLVDGLDWKTVQLPNFVGVPGPAEQTTGVVQAQAASPAQLDLLLRFPDIQVRGPITLRVEAPENHNVRLKMPREIELPGRGSLKELKLESAVDVKVRGAIEVRLDEPLKMNVSLKHSYEELIAQMRKIMRKSSGYKLTVREPLEIVTSNPEERLQVKRIADGGSLGIRRALPGPVNADVALKIEDEVLQHLVSRSFVSSIQVALAQFYVKTLAKNRGLRITDLTRASAKPVVAYKLGLQLAELADPRRLSEWDAVLVRSFDGWESATVTRRESPDTVTDAVSFSPWLLSNNMSAPHRDAPVMPHSIGPSLSPHH
eukprot:tig00020537_g10300.t1